jgi:hypothetical protein
MTVSLQGLHPGDGRGAAAAWFAKCDAFHALKKHKHRYIITYDHILRARNDARASGCAAAAPIGTIGTGRRSSACPETLRVDAGADPAGPLTDSLRRPWSAPSAACNLRQVWHPARAFGSSGSGAGSPAVPPVIVTAVPCPRAGQMSRPTEHHGASPPYIPTIMTSSGA